MYTGVRQVNAGPQQVQRRAGGDQFHERGGVALHLPQVLQPGWARQTHGQDHHAQSVARQFGALHRVFHAGRQGTGLRLRAGQPQDATAM